MSSHSINRRAFLRNSIVLGAGVACLGSASSVVAKTKSLNPIRLGGKVYEKVSGPDELALAHRKLGYGAAYCPRISIKDTAQIRAYSEAFSRHNVVIAEVGRWVNLMEADSAKRKANFDEVIDGLALAEEIGARCCVDIAGSFNPTSWFGPHPENLSKAHFDASVENARKIIDAVNPKRAKFAYEMMGWALPDSPESYLKMIKAVDRPAFGVHLDPCNLVNSPTRFYDNKALLNECFDKLGKWIASCHAKDLTWDIEMNVHFREIVPGKGSIDYATYLRRLAELPHGPPLMMEHLANEDEYTAGRLYIFEAGKKAGIDFV